MSKPPNKREMARAKDLLPRVLAKLAESTGTATHLLPLWEEIAGPKLAKMVRPAALDKDALVLDVQSASWLKFIEPSADDLIRRLRERLPGTGIRRLVFRTR